MNEYDSDKMADVLGAAQVTSPPTNVDEADLILFNTCLVREKAQEKVFSDLGRIRHLKEKGVLIGVGGCVASQEGAEIIKAPAPFVDVVFGPRPCTACPSCSISVLPRPNPRSISPSPKSKSSTTCRLRAWKALRPLSPSWKAAPNVQLLRRAPPALAKKSGRPFEDVLEVEVAAWPSRA